VVEEFGLNLAIAAINYNPLRTYDMHIFWQDMWNIVYVSEHSLNNSLITKLLWIIITLGTVIYLT
jgi:hypothetical protein